MLRSFGFLILAMAMSSSALAISAEDAYQALKFSTANFSPEGAVCEQVAKLELMVEYPTDKYDIALDVEYTDGRKAYGELDVIVFDKASNKAILIAEVKCWKSLEGAKKKAKEQRSRFLRAIQNGFPLKISSPTYTFQRSQFVDVKDFIMIAQKGSVTEGFDRELEMSLDELKDLRRRIETCQTYKNCK